MDRLFVFVLAGLLLASAFGGALAGASLVEEENGRIVVEVRFDLPSGAASEGIPSTLDTPGLPALRYDRFYVALPPVGSYRVTPSDGASEERRDKLPAIVVNPDSPGTAVAVSLKPGFYPESPVRVSEPFVFRGTRVIAVDCFASQVDYEAGIERRWSGYRVEVTYPPSAVAAETGEADPLLSGLVVNRETAPAPAGRGSEGGAFAVPRSAQAGVPDPHFSLSSNWIKIYTDSACVYSISGDDLARIGVDLDGIQNPASFRVFTLGGRELERRDASGQPFTDANGTWRPGQWMTECDILVEYGGDGSFDPADRVIFYGVGTQGWSDLYSAGASRYAYYDHPYTKENVYYLTWDDSPGFPDAPRRMTPVGAAPLAPEPDVTAYEERLYFERNLIEAFSFGGDGWLWIDVPVPPAASGPETITFPLFQAHDVVTTRSQTFRTLALAPYRSGVSNENHHAVYVMNNVEIGDTVFDSIEAYEDAGAFEQKGQFLVEGTNVLRLRVPRDLNDRDYMYFDHYVVLYWRDLAARGNKLLFGSAGTVGSANFQVTNFDSGTPLYVFDVSDLFHPRVLTEFEQSDIAGRRQVRFSRSVGDTVRYFWAGGTASFEKPVRIARHVPRDLRNVTAGPDMLVISHPSFQSAASTFKSHRESRYPYGGVPSVSVAMTEAVFDNFSGGLVDPTGIRNYCKFLYDNFKKENGYPRLAFLLLLGDANIDFKNYATSQENLVTTNFNLHPSTLDAYATDDWFAEMEPPAPSGASLIQFAVGRLPAGSAAEASFLVGKVIDYETRAEFGPWRDRAILVADDEKTPNRPPEPMFVSDSENIAHGFMAGFLEPVKIYLTEYPLIGSYKPASRVDFLKEWNDGALVINYIGHGSSAQMADEQVFLGTDVSNLRNGLRLPLFMAFSCTIGDFGRAQSVSLAEKLLLWEPGGAVGAITASEVSYIQPNSALNNRIFQEFTPRSPGAPKPVGAALLAAKVGVMGTVEPGNFELSEENNQKYNLLGDPSWSLASPRRQIALSESDVDTLTTGKRATIRGTVLNNGAHDTGFNGSVDLVVREPDDRSGYTSEDGVTRLFYRYPGGIIYRGTADVTTGSFEFDVKIPRYAVTGPLAFVRAYANNGLNDNVALDDSVFMVEPSPNDTTVLKPLDGPPRVDLGFKGGQTIVKPGVVLQAKIADADGINILNTTPEGKVALVFDRTNLPVDVTDSFQFDHGGTDTSGMLLYPLPDLSVGEHRAILKVADSFGQVKLDTLAFTMTDPSNYVAQMVLNYPNPFLTSTYFLLNLTDPADVQLDIFTVSGKKIRTLQERKDPGEAWILWDGKDWAGDAIANGTYLYVARVRFEGIDRPPVVLRGKVVKIE